MFVFSIIKKSATRDEREAILHEGSVMRKRKKEEEKERERKEQLQDLATV